MTVRAFVGIGSNLGDRKAHCVEAAAALGRLPQTTLVQLSPWIETEPAEGVAGGPFLNGVAEIATGLSPGALLRSLQAIEMTLGRPAGHPRGSARTMDLDLLLYGDRQIEEDGLVIPHPRLAERRFVLEPLNSIAPEVTHPLLRRTAAELLRRLDAPTRGRPTGVVP